MNGPETPAKITSFEHIFKEDRFEAEQHLANIEQIQAANGQPIIYGYKGEVYAGFVHTAVNEAPILVPQRFNCQLFTMRVTDVISSKIEHEDVSGTLVQLPIVSNIEKNLQVRRSLLYSESDIPVRSIQKSPYHALISIGHWGVEHLLAAAADLHEEDIALQEDKALAPILKLLERHA